MTVYRIRLVNRDFSADEEIHARDAGEARKEALRGALQIGTDEICRGKTFFGAEICIEGDGERPERLLIAIGTSPLGVAVGP